MLGSREPSKLYFLSVNIAQFYPFGEGFSWLALEHEADRLKERAKPSRFREIKAHRRDLLFKPDRLIYSRELAASLSSPSRK
jgi:hypothetical protein